MKSDLVDKLQNNIRAVTEAELISIYNESNICCERDCNVFDNIDGSTLYEKTIYATYNRLHYSARIRFLVNSSHSKIESMIIVDGIKIYNTRRNIEICCGLYTGY